MTTCVILGAVPHTPERAKAIVDANREAPSMLRASDALKSLVGPAVDTLRELMGNPEVNPAVRAQSAGLILRLALEREPEAVDEALAAAKPASVTVLQKDLHSVIRARLAAGAAQR